jgi:hypothetical protein
MRSPYRESWRLRGIERELRRTEPHLVAMLAIFARLNAGEAMLSAERVRRPGAWVRLVPALLMGAITALAMAANWVSGRVVRLCVALRRRAIAVARVAFGTPAAARNGTMPRVR